MIRIILSILTLLFTQELNGKEDSLAPSDIQVSTVDKFLASETPSLDLFEGLPNVVIHNHVHAITGTFFDTQTDLEIPGIDFNLQRTYVSQDHTRGALLHGWNHNHEDVLRTESHSNHRYAVSKGKSGGEYLYKGNFGDPFLKIASKNFQKGVTNCNGSGISGRTNVLNHRLNRRAGEKYSLKTGSGAKLHFEKIFGKKHYYQIVHQRTSSDHHLNYSYDLLSERVSKIVYQNSQQRELSTLRFTHPSKTDLKKYSKKRKKGIKNPTVKVASSDGRQVKYTFQAFVGEVESDNSDIDYRRYRLIKATRPNAPEETFEYSNPRCCKAEQLIRKNRPDGRYLEIEYYTKGKSFSREKVGALKGPTGTSPSPVVLYRFFYEKQASDSATTLVQDGLGHRIIYYYNPKNFRLNTVEKLYGNSSYSLHSLERLKWGDVENGSPLLSREVYDNNRQLVLKRSYKYDSRGNILKSTLEGNLTGKSAGEKFVQTFTYSNDGRNLVTSTTDGPVAKEITYCAGSDLVAAEYTRAGAYQKRVFYAYDENNAVTLMITDDGTGRERDDLTGVTERLIQRIQNTTFSPVGLPETVESFYLDLKNSKEVLLQRCVNRYDSWGRCVEKATYDSMGDHMFTCRWEYNNYGQKTVEVDPLGVTTYFSYDLNGNLLSEHRLSDDRHKKHTYDLCNRLIKTEILHRGTSFVETFEYDIMGNKISATDVYGNRTGYQYDSQGQLCTIIHPETRDADFELISRKEFKEYDSLGNVSLVVDGNGNRTSTRSTVRGAPYQIEHPDGSKETFEYSLTGNLVNYTLPNGLSVRTEYDEFSRPVVENCYGASGEIIRTKRKVYNTFHLIAETDPNGLTTHYNYDGAGRLIQTVKGDWTETISYDTMGRKAIVSEGSGDDIVIHTTRYDNRDRIISDETTASDGTLQLYKGYEYDDDNNCTLIRTYNEAGESIHRTEYNALGEAVKIIDPLNHCTHITYDLTTLCDRTHRRVTTVDPLGLRHIQYYNELRELVREEDYNAYGKLIKRTSFTYDNAGNKICRVDHVISPSEENKDLTTFWEYDEMNRLVTTSENIEKHRFRIVRRTYDAAGNLESVQKPDGVLLTYKYDLLGRIENYFSSDGTVNYSFDYDHADHPVKIIDHISATTTYRQYDLNGNLIEEILGNGLKLSYAHDTLGRVSQITYPDDSAVRYSYRGIHLQNVERLNRIGEVIYSHNYTQYDLSGNIVGSSLIGDLGGINYHYDLMNRIKGIHTPFWSEKNHSYDAVGNLVSRDWDDRTLVYGYDDLNQLQSESGIVENRYLNDSMFNQVVVNDTPRTFNNAHELQGVYKYDINGNVIEKGRVSFEYDALNRLRKVILADGITYEYQYDSYHRRLAKISDTAEKYLYYENLDIGAADISDNITQLRVLGKSNHAEIGAAIAIELDGAIYAPLHDTQGNVATLISTTTGLIVESCRYSAYGKEILASAFGIHLTPWRCASKRMDNETGFINFGRRFYDPEELRWISLDPILISEGTNRYNYLENNPFRYVDPDGRFVHFLVLAAWGGTTAATFFGGLTVAEVALGTAVGVGCCAAAYVATENNIRVPKINFELKTPHTAYGRNDYQKGYLPSTSLLYEPVISKDFETAVSDENIEIQQKGKKRGKDNAVKGDIPRDPKTLDYLPDPGAEGAHTTLGIKQGRQGPYTQGATFDETGKFKGRTDVTDHGRRDHPSPHFHPATAPNSAKSPPQPIINRFLWNMI